MSQFEKFKNAKHPSAEARAETIRKTLDIDEGQEYDHLFYSSALRAARNVFNLSEKFLYRQYYLRDMAVEALERGDTDEAMEYLRDVGNSGNGVRV